MKKCPFWSGDEPVLSKKQNMESASLGLINRTNHQMGFS